MGRLRPTTAQHDADCHRGAERTAEGLADPPESLRKARHEKIMQEQPLTVRGYVCSKGQAWWIDWIDPHRPGFARCAGRNGEAGIVNYVLQPSGSRKTTY